MTGYRDGYDIRKWAAAEAANRPRRRSTRWVLAATMALLLVWLVVSTALSEPDERGFPGLPFVWLPMLSAMYSPFARDTWLTDRGLKQYDEFERAALARATSRAYLAIMIGVTAGLLATAGALQFGWELVVTPHLLVTWTLSVLAIGFALPVLLAEWTVPMPDPEDQPL